MSEVSRIRRLLQLVDLLSSGRTCNATELADHCGVSRRTIFRDIATLETAGIHVLYDDSRQGYWLNQREFLPSSELTIEETLSLIVLSYELGDETSALSFWGDARSAALKLTNNLPNNLREFIRDVTPSIIIRSDSQSVTVHEKETFHRLLKAFSVHSSVRIRYYSVAENKVISTRLSPYRLLFSRHSWYVIGRSSVHRSIRTFKLGRISEVVLLDQRYEIPPRFSLDRFLGDAWHLIREAKQRYQIHIRFQEKVARNVAEVQWHKTQQIHWNEDGSLDFKVTVDGLGELSWWILGYGDQAEVLSPPELREKLISMIKRMENLYAPKKPQKATS